MPTIKDIIVRKPSEGEREQFLTWPTWTCDPSTFDWAYTEQETCLVIEGKVTVTDGHDSVRFGPGDVVIFPKDLECTWTIEQAVVKHYHFS